MFHLRHVPSLHTMLSLILKTSCVVLLETVVNFLQAFTLKGIIMEINTTTYNHFCLKNKLNRVYIVSFFMCMCTNLAGHIVSFFFEITPIPVAMGRLPVLLKKERGLTMARYHFTTHPLIFHPFYCFACNYHTTGSRLNTCCIYG